VNVGDTIVIAILNKPPGASNVIRVNGKIFYNVALPLTEVADIPGIWQVDYLTPGCATGGAVSPLTITAAVATPTPTPTATPTPIPTP
jgi:hypothetical protein